MIDENDTPHVSGETSYQNSITTNGDDCINTCRSNLNQILDALELKYCGNRDALSMLVLSAVSAHTRFTKKLHIALIGSSDVGKSGAMSIVRNMLMPEHKYNTMKVSPKVMYYQANEGMSFNNVIVALDDITDGDTEILKNIANSTNEPPSFTTLVNQKPLEIMFDEQPAVWTTKVELLNDHDGQADRRFFTVEILPNDDVKQFIYDSDRFDVSKTSLPQYTNARDLLSRVMKRDQYVTLPECSMAPLNRNSDTNFFMAMIRSIAKINTIDTDSDNITASEQDVKDARRLYMKHIVQTISIKLDTAKLLQYVPEIISEHDHMNPTESTNTIRSIYNAQKMHLKLSSKQVRAKLKELAASGIIEETHGINHTLMYCTFDEGSQGVLDGYDF